MRSRGGGWRIYGGMGDGHTRLPPPDDNPPAWKEKHLRAHFPLSPGLSRRLRLGPGEKVA